MGTEIAVALVNEMPCTSLARRSPEAKKKRGEEEKRKTTPIMLEGFRPGARISRIPQRFVALAFSLCFPSSVDTRELDTEKVTCV